MFDRIVSVVQKFGTFAGHASHAVAHAAVTAAIAFGMLGGHGGQTATEGMQVPSSYSAVSTTNALRLEHQLQRHGLLPYNLKPAPQAQVIIPRNELSRVWPQRADGARLSGHHPRHNFPQTWGHLISHSTAGGLAARPAGGSRRCDPNPSMPSSRTPGLRWCRLAIARRPCGNMSMPGAASRLMRRPDGPRSSRRRLRPPYTDPARRETAIWTDNEELLLQLTGLE